MSAATPTNPLSLDLARNFLFSTVLNKLTVMSQGLLSDEEKNSLAKLTEQFKALVGNDNALQSVLSGKVDARQATLNEITSSDVNDNAFFNDAIDATIDSSQDLLVRNRFIVSLRRKIKELSDKPYLQETLSIASIYFSEDTIRPATINGAVDNALGSMYARYHADRIPAKDEVTGILFGLVDEAIREHQAAPETRVVPDIYTPERLASLKVNM
ncbi:MAG: hypothetical protein HRT94_00215 [Alphaproteobacteria bacterium]|nr:hypothetical protein [Alphaproteobacteria bacterium]